MESYVANGESIPPKVYTEKELVQLIVQMYCNPHLANQISRQLTEFQTSHEAWNMCLILLLRCSSKPPEVLQAFAEKLPGLSEKFLVLHNATELDLNDSVKDIVAFFTSQTLCSLCQAGYENLIQNAYGGNIPLGLAQIRSILLELLWLFSDNPGNPTVRQLSQAVVATLVFSFLAAIRQPYHNQSSSINGNNNTTSTSESSFFENQSPAAASQECSSSLWPPPESALRYAQECISELLLCLKRSMDMTPCIFDSIASLPVDIYNKKLALTNHQRLSILYLILYQTPQVFTAIAEIHNTTCSGTLSSSSSPLVLLSQLTPTSILKLFNNHQEPLPFYLNNTLRDRITRRATLRCFQSWLEAHTKFHRQLTNSSEVITFPPMPHEARLLSVTSIIPITLVNFEHEIREAMSTAHHNTIPPSTIPPFDDPNLYLEADLDIELTESNAILSTACDTLSEILEYLYSIVAYATVDHATSTTDSTSAIAYNETMPVISWWSLGTLLALLDSLSRIDGSLRTLSQTLHDNNNNISDITTTRLTLDDDNELIKVVPSLLPKSVLKAFVLVMEKFSQVFFPALIFMIQFDVLTETLGDCHPDNVALLIPEVLERETILQKARSLLALMVDLLFHSSLELRHQALDFWYSLMGNQFIQQQGQLEAASAATTSSSSTVTNNNKNNHVMTQNVNNTYDNGHKDKNIPGDLPNEVENALILPAFESFVDALLKLVSVSSDIDKKKTEFMFGAWLKYRDSCAMNLTDVTAVLTCYPLIKKAGSEVLECLEAIKINPASVTSLWRRIEAGLFVLSTIASRAQAGVDEYIPAAIEALPTLPYIKCDGSIECYIMSAAASRLMLWTAGYIGSRRDLFAQSFQLLHSFVPQLVSLNKAIGLRDSDYRLGSRSELTIFREFCECTMIESMNAVVSAAATTLTRDMSVPESDLTFVLNGLAELVMITDLAMESRCSLVISAGAVLQCLPIEKMQKFHYQLVKALHDKATLSLQEYREGSKVLSQEAIEFLKLFFTALESVQPVDDIRLPPPSPNAVPLDRSSEFRHPVLNVLEEFWGLLQKSLESFHFHEMLVESACHAVVRIFSMCQSHSIRYEIFHKFFEALIVSFQKTPTVFHLGALRSMLGIFGYRSEKPIHQTLSNCLLACTQIILTRMQSGGVREYVGASPDLVGMTLDCTNTCLTSAYLTECLVQLDVFHESLSLCITLTPECHHPKVLMTTILLMTRFASWFDPAAVKTKKEAYETTIIKCSELVNNLAERLNLIEKMIRSIIQAITETFQGNSQWLGIAGTLMLQLMQAPSHAQTARISLRAALNACPKHIVPVTLMEEICTAFDITKLLNHRYVCQTLQHLADESETNWQKAQFVITSSSTPSPSVSIL